MDYLVLVVHDRDGLEEMTYVVFEEGLTSYSEELGLLPKFPLGRALHLHEKVQGILEGSIESDHVVAIFESIEAVLLHE